MLVCGGVEDDLRMIFLKQVAHLALVGDGRDLDVEVDLVAVVALHLLLYLVRAIFVDIEDDDTARIVLCDLSDQLASDRAASARDQTHFVLDIALYALVVERDLLSAEKVADVDVARLPDEVDVADHLAHIGQNFELAARLHAQRQDGLTRLRIDGRDRENDRADVVFAHEPGDLLRRADDLDVADDAAELVRIVVDEADGIVDAAAARQLLQDRAGGIARAYDHRALFLPRQRLVAQARVDHLVYEARDDDHARGRKEDVEIDGVGFEVLAELLQVLGDGHLARKPMQKRLVEDRKEHGGDERRSDYAQIVLAASITPHDLVDPERPKADDEQDRGDRQSLEGVDNDLGAYDVCLTENDRSHIAYANHERVRDEHRPFAERAYAVRLLLDLDLNLFHLPSPAIPLRRCSSSLLFSYLCLLSAHYRGCDALSRRSRWGC